MFKKMTVLGVALFTLLAAKASCNAQELLQTTNFSSGVSLPWHLSQAAEDHAYTYVEDGRYVVHIDKKGTSKWDVQIRHREISIVQGWTYKVKFSLTADKNTKVYAKIGDKGEPYGEVWNNKWTPYSITAGQTLKVEDTFVADRNYKEAEFAFHLGGELTGPLPVEVKFISMSLNDYIRVITPTPTPTPVRNIRVNQLGYLPQASKKATLKVDSGTVEPIDWQLKDSKGAVVASGKTKPFEGQGEGGIDLASGDRVHIIDFSNYFRPGKDYQLVAGVATSLPFDIGNDIYATMKYDALKYFYYARSGIENKMPYTLESKWARLAGHTKDMAVPASGKDYLGPESMDCTGGWYDGSDHGKYMVSGGLALWLLQNQYEYSVRIDKDDDFGDGNLIIPESGNEINDLLDEARWEMEWMLKMQIPEGYDRSGMAIHKMGDAAWTALATRPDQDYMDRVYYPPSTAATLSLTACAAQAARIWKAIDTDFSDKCMTAAERAYKAAKANSAIFYPDGIEPGTFTYGDNYVEDDFYWAACEMYVTTGNEAYLADLKGYKESQKVPLVSTSENDSTDGSLYKLVSGQLGTITLALHKYEEFPQAVASIKEVADKYIEIQKKEGYGIPLAVATYISNFGGSSETITGYPYDSNSYVINAALVMAYAYHLSSESKYLNGLTESMDYILGRNAEVKSYVSGYGENPLKYPHHRFFCPQIDPSYPSVPPGFLSGGPNSGCQDPWVSGAGLKVNKAPAQKCYLDHVESWSTNEVKITLNAALAWVSCFLDSQDITIAPIEIMEDINKDGSVNMADVVLVAKVFGFMKDDPEFDKKCDLNDDGTINISDIVKLALKFGYTYTL
ncbi:glycoside hydrolase family 9 protein [Pseudobacteroides cellulosolvens]|nr:glycoside hydrolase family 9 protein [Pseudobacteroides cellulosolvens]